MWQQENGTIFSSKLLLNIDWKNSSTKWDIITNRSQFFIHVIDSCDNEELNNILNLVSKIGFEELGVVLIPKIISLIKKSDFSEINITYCEIWVQKLFTFKKNEILSNSEYLKDIIYLLNEMIFRNSFIAFNIRDYFVSYI